MLAGADETVARLHRGSAADVYRSLQTRIIISGRTTHAAEMMRVTVAADWWQTRSIMSLLAADTVIDCSALTTTGVRLTTVGVVTATPTT